MRAKWCNALKILVHVRPYIKGLFSYVKGEEKEKRIKEQHGSQNLGRRGKRCKFM